MTIASHAPHLAHASHDSHNAPRPRASAKLQPTILFSVARQLFAIAADSVQEIRSTDSIALSANEISEPSVPKIRHTIERGPHLYFVVNAGVHFQLPVTRPTLVLILRQFRVAVLVDRIEEMAEIPAVINLPGAFTGDETRWYRGLAYLNDHVLPVINPAGFISDAEFRLFDRTAQSQWQQPLSPPRSNPLRMSVPAFASAASDSFVLLHLIGRRFALPSNIVAELAPPVRLHNFPHTSPLLTGVIVRRGRIVPVFDAERALSGKSSLAHRFYLVARHDRGETAELGAIPVGGECELVSGTLSPPAADPSSDQPQASYIAGEITVAGQLVPVLDLSALLHAGGADALHANAIQAPEAFSPEAALPHGSHTANAEPPRS